MSWSPNRRAAMPQAGGLTLTGLRRSQMTNFGTQK
jgi:hypothetical protein